MMSDLTWDTTHLLTEVKEPLRQALLKLLNAAVCEGRCNWDTHYGHTNEYHLSDLDTWEGYAEVIAWIKQHQTRNMDT